VHGANRLHAAAAILEGFPDLQHVSLEVRFLDHVAGPDVVEEIALADRARAFGG
jgi:hypothetical protein